MDFFCNQRPNSVSPKDFDVLKTNLLSKFLQHGRILRYPNLKIKNITRATNFFVKTSNGIIRYFFLSFTSISDHPKYSFSSEIGYIKGIWHL